MFLHLIFSRQESMCKESALSLIGHINIFWLFFAKKMAGTLRSVSGIWTNKVWLWWFGFRLEPILLMTEKPNFFCSGYKWNKNETKFVIFLPKFSQNPWFTLYNLYYNVVLWFNGLIRGKLHLYIVNHSVVFVAWRSLSEGWYDSKFAINLTS